jgi:hypothetical protein
MKDPTQHNNSEWKEQSLYAGRGLADRTVEALVANGILEPERLLFMTEAQLKVMPGIGKVAMSNIGAYRAKFLR